MDIGNFDKITEIIQKVLWAPFLIAFGCGSRICWDYLENSISPTKKKVGALFVLSSFSSTIFILVMKAQDISKANIDIGILVLAFLGHTTLTFFMEHKDEILRKLLDFGISIISSFKKK